MRDKPESGEDLSLCLHFKNQDKKIVEFGKIVDFDSDICKEENKTYTHAKSDKPVDCGDLELVKLTPRKIAEMHMHGHARDKPRSSKKKDAVTAASKMHCYERSPGGGGSVMKKNLRGTPTKCKKVSAIRKIFKKSQALTSSSQTSLQTGELVGLLQPAGINFNLQAISKLRRQGREICVDQPEERYQTGPRQAGVMAGELAQDWTDKTVQANLSQ